MGPNPFIFFSQVHHLTQTCYSSVSEEPLVPLRNHITLPICVVQLEQLGLCCVAIAVADHLLEVEGVVTGAWVGTGLQQPSYS